MKNKILDIILLAVVIITAIFVIYFMISIKNMIREYACYKLPFNEFYQSEMCSKYWEDYND